MITLVDILFHYLDVYEIHVALTLSNETLDLISIVVNFRPIKSMSLSGKNNIPVDCPFGRNWYFFPH